ncbi:MAG: hypothetical protein K2X56_08785 [Mycobacterium pseudokansasii]|uniref:Uncharacterized protein n=1 Tax=Mycobacterium pseudokansasii TaxID=2341080 RepID=A0A498QNV1_9MYCO|nr:hypothetical protein [Mycobacterium pseudokansasii]KZS63172.1 hypothetical protein A4G27_22505 [Mycobacterium kansasii]MBY0388180.1 hypothetical protein [Mycobacterium pseudokansasii]VAZ92513.1 hypothetical protein LAUMK35_02026 [Mycobacterium pseudokansasii]VAZ93607.1 hypothetical protein LAUMK21_02029 [Mycobacterium pseudokansasii]VBA49398.1 hypothetical protein LAUMK142_01909 [Mycobacterium pseudokansasii]
MAYPQENPDVFRDHGPDESAAVRSPELKGEHGSTLAVARAIQPQTIVDPPVVDSNGKLVLGGDSGIRYTALSESRLPCHGGAA